MILKTPILFLVFNRPEATQEAFNAIRKAKPNKLYVAADGPRAAFSDEHLRTLKVREIATNVDWDCEVKTLFRDKNLGCGRAVSEGISWFFQQEEQGIILEDDCVPNPSFFTFCADMLERYQNDNGIMHIGGSNFQFGTKRGDADYYFSAVCHVWGWATWRRAWVKYKFDLNKADEIPDSTFKKVFANNALVINYFKDVFLKMKSGLIDTWDFQWFYTLILNEGISISPNVNLVKNIGFGEDGTHTLHQTEWNIRNSANSIQIRTHPKSIVIDYEADDYTFREIMGIKKPATRKAQISHFMKYAIPFYKKIFPTK